MIISTHRYHVIGGGKANDNHLVNGDESISIGWKLVDIDVLECTGWKSIGNGGEEERKEGKV